MNVDDTAILVIDAQEKLADYFDKLMLIAKNSSKSSEDSILLAGAMMAVSRVLFYDHLSEKEAKNLISANLPLPAYDQSLKASHVFNILDARGVISIAQRAEFISRIRDLVKEVGQKWLEEK